MPRRIRLFVFGTLLSLASFGALGAQPRPDTLTFFQLNLWEGLVNVEGGLKALEDELVDLLPDVASFCEFPSQGDEAKEEPSAEYILGQLIRNIQERTGVRYFKTSLTGSGTRGILSKHPPIQGASSVISLKDGCPQPWFYRSVIDFHGREIAIYSSHSTPDWYACYLPRGYGDGSPTLGWNRLPKGSAAISESDVIWSDASGDRVQMAIDLIHDSDFQAGEGRLCIFGGDLNQPSHLDWTEETKDLFDHGGMVIPWSISTSLLSHGFSDAYRVVYPDPAENPGITWPVHNKDARKSTSWAPEADERDRIDFVYFREDPRIKVADAKMVGPGETILRGRPSDDLKEKETSDLKLPASDRWCSDHRGLLVRFVVF